MKKIIGILLLIFSAATVVGMIIENAKFWLIYNYSAIPIFAISGIILLKEK